MDSVLPRALAGAPHVHLETQCTFHVEQEENLLFFPPFKSTLSHRSGSRIKFHSTIKKTPTHQ